MMKPFGKKTPVVAPQATAVVGFDTLPTEVEESADGYTVNIFAPGMNKAAFDINVSERAVHVYGERKPELVTSAHIRANFSFKQEFPVALDANSAAVSYTDGVLTMTLPKAISTRRVKLQVA